MAYTQISQNKIHFLHGNTLRKLLCKLKDQIATKDKNIISYEIDCSNCQAVFLGESKRSLKTRSDEHETPLRNYDCEKNGTERRLILRKIKENIHLKNPNHINNIFYMVSEKWLPNLR